MPFDRVLDELVELIIRFNLFNVWMAASDCCMAVKLWVETLGIWCFVGYVLLPVIGNHDRPVKQLGIPKVGDSNQRLMYARSGRFSHQINVAARLVMNARLYVFLLINQWKRKGWAESKISFMFAQHCFFGLSKKKKHCFFGCLYKWY